MLSEKKVEEIYQKKTQLEHILLRPDTYIGSTEFLSQPMWVFDPENKRMVHRTIQFVPGLFKIFDEILVNAADNKIRDPTMDTIKVEIDTENHFISVYNNGNGIPVELHAVEKVYIPELIFGHLLTSSNYNDTEKKVTGGRNGYGAKLCNIFSKEFIVETADLVSKKRFKQVFRNNMSLKGEPQISTNSKDAFTKISFKPDLEKFGMTNFDHDLVCLFTKRVYDLAGCVKNIKVFLNGERLSVKNFKQYTELYFNDTDSDFPKCTPVYETVGDRWELCIALSDGQFQQVSFVNSICTYKGGTHVNYVVDQIVSNLVDIVKKKHKTTTVKPFQIRNHILIFINCLVENPSFDSQTKENMTLRTSAFGSKCDVSEEFIKKILKTGIVEMTLSWLKSKQDKELKKTDGHKSARLSGIPKLDDANMAGTKQAGKCTLILTEGDSAKALAVSGLSVVGRDYYGVFPLRGKLLNVREAAHKQIMENAEITHIKQILGLQHGKVYVSAETLRYGHLMIMTDQDHDGSHIKGLLINFIDHFWPSLLKVSGFLVEFITPIVKATKGKTEIAFYTIPEYEKWKAENDDGKGYFIKYYKGLGTSTAADAKKYFSTMKIHMKEFSCILDEERSLIDMAFNKKKADERKEWLKNFQSGTFIDHSVNKITYTDFIHKELILFSMADNIRSLPSMVDGLKPGLRKILYACFKRKLKDEIKIAQLAGYISEHSAYHHGDQSLCASIIGMAQDFVGSNNINLLMPCGQFGTRIQGGKDAASPRYVFTKLSVLVRQLFKEEDDKLLTYLNDDGQNIEPEYYVPIIPMILVNGSEGIGTGWSTFIPNYNPKDIANNLLRKLDGKEMEKMHPWYRGFNGSIEEISVDRYRLVGSYQKVDCETLRITELPIGSWTQTYKEFLESLLPSSSNEKQEFSIKDFKEYHTDTKVHFDIKMGAETMSLIEEEGLDKKMKLSTTISLANMVAFDQNGRIRKYVNPEHILEEFYDLRLEYYQKRKTYLVSKLKNEWNKLDNKVRFILDMNDGKLIIQKKKKDALVKELVSRGYQPFLNNEAIESRGGDEDGEGNTDEKGFDYLLGMPLWSLTFERMEKLLQERNEKDKELKQILALTAKDLWRMDLKIFLNELNEYSKDYAHVIHVACPVKQSEKFESLVQSNFNPIKLEDGYIDLFSNLDSKISDEISSVSISTTKNKKEVKKKGEPTKRKSPIAKKSMVLLKSAKTALSSETSNNLDAYFVDNDKSKIFMDSPLIPLGSKSHQQKKKMTIVSDESESDYAVSEEEKPFSVRKVSTRPKRAPLVPKHVSSGTDVDVLAEDEKDDIFQLSDDE